MNPFRPRPSRRDPLKQLVRLVWILMALYVALLAFALHLALPR